MQSEIRDGWQDRRMDECMRRRMELLVVPPPNAQNCFAFARSHIFMHFQCSPCNGTLMFTIFTCVLGCFQGSDEGFDTASGR